MTQISQAIPKDVPVAVVEEEVPVVDILRHPTKLLREMHSLLEKKRADATSLIAGYREDLKQTFDDEERTHHSKEELTSLIEIQNLMIQDIDDALDRIRNKQYGICTRTRKLIPLDRLLACPTARTCV